MQLIPYKATPEVFIGLKNQDLQIAFEILAPLMSNIRSGNLRAVAVTVTESPEDTFLVEVSDGKVIGSFTWRYVAGRNQVERAAGPLPDRGLTRTLFLRAPDFI